MVAVNTSSIHIVSLSDDNVQGDSASFDTAISGDGRYVVYSSSANNLSDPPAASFVEVYLRDTLTGATTRISSTPTGGASNGDSRTPSISADGRFVAYESLASNQVAGDTDIRDVFVRDMQSGTLRRVSETSDGTGGDDDSGDASVSADGRFIVFESAASNLAAADSNAAFDIFRKDLFTGALALVSVGSGGVLGDASSFNPVVSDDGRFVTFSSAATNLVAGDTNVDTDIFQRDMVLGTTVRVSVTSAETQVLNRSVEASASADGRYVVFRSLSGALAPGGVENQENIFLRDTLLGTTELISVSSSGVTANFPSFNPSVSDDGRFVVFHSDATNLVTGADANAGFDVFLRDRLTSTTVRLSVGLGGSDGNGSSQDGTISADGRFVTFRSGSTNLVAGDVNGFADVFRVSLFATNSADFLIGSDVPDTISGLAGADIIRSGLGADTLDGGTGGDTLEGGDGNDIYRVNTPGDQVVEAVGEGLDNVVSTVSYRLGEGQEVETLQLSLTTGTTALNLTGNGFSNVLRGNNGANTLNGGGAPDGMYGLAGNDLYVVDNGLDQVFEAAGQGTDTIVTSVTYTLAAGVSVEKLTASSSAGAATVGLTGNAFVNALRGHAAANLLDGKGGNDSLTGLGGNDTFAFTTALGSANVDTIADFAGVAGNNDSIRLENAVFVGLLAGQPLGAAFVGNATGTATAAGHRIVYDTTDGRLLYDADGSGAGAAVQFATLTGAPTLSAGDIFVV